MAGSDIEMAGVMVRRRRGLRFRRWALRLVLLLLLLGLAAAGWAQAKVVTLPGRVRLELKNRGSHYVPLAQISPKLQQAIVATEDRTFYTNPGVSFEGMARAFWVDLQNRAFTEGGSTITQELARDQFLTPQKTVSRKIKEIILALAITRNFTKPEILELYLNEVYFGHGASGIAAAAATYFHRSPALLTWAQASLLAGLPQAPTLYDPYRNRAAARARQAQVLAALVSNGTLTAPAARAIAAAPLGLGGTAWLGTKRSSSG